MWVWYAATPSGGKEHLAADGASNERPPADNRSVVPARATATA